MHRSLVSHPVARGAAALGLLFWSGVALADLMLFPTRIVLEKNQRAAQVELINQGRTPETYRISLVNRRMSEAGEFIAVETPGPGELFADPLLRYSPRQVTIAPGGSQTVRVLLRKPADLAAGEYRSHLQFDRVAETNADSSLEGLAKRESGEIGVSITALVGASIPLIVRHGETQASVSLSDLALSAAGAKEGPALSFTIRREGNRSVYGDLAVSFTPAGGATVDLAKAGGVAVYVPNSMRRARMSLASATSLPAGLLRLSYRERAEAGSKLLAEATLSIP